MSLSPEVVRRQNTKADPQNNDPNPTKRRPNPAFTQQTTTERAQNVYSNRLAVSGARSSATARRLVPAASDARTRRGASPCLARLLALLSRLIRRLGIQAGVRHLVRPGRDFACPVQRSSCWGTLPRRGAYTPHAALRTTALVGGSDTTATANFHH